MSHLPARLYERDVVQGLVPWSLVPVLSSYLHSQGVDLKELLAQPTGAHTALPALAMEAPSTGRCSAEVYCSLLIRAAERLRDPLLGLHLGQTVAPEHLGALGYVLLACDNLGAALLRVHRYHRLLHDMNPVEFKLEGENFQLQWGVARGKPGALFDEAGITGFVHFARNLCGQAISPAQVDFVNPWPSDIQPYTQFFGCPVRFAQPMTRLVIPLAALQLPLRQADQTLLKLMEQQVDAAMALLPDMGDLADTVRRVIVHMAPQGMPELEQVARELKLAPRVFYRRLAEQQLNFRALRESALCQVAEMHLSEGRLTLQEIALLLGYSEQSAFSRAFKRWRGVSPLQWKQQKRLP